MAANDVNFSDWLFVQSSYREATALQIDLALDLANTVVIFRQQLIQ